MILELQVLAQIKIYETRATSENAICIGRVFSIFVTRILSNVM